MKILLLCNKSPWPANEGGSIGMYFMINGLLDAGHELKILAANTNKSWVDPNHLPKSFQERTNIELVPVNLSINPVTAFFNLFSRKSLHITRFKTKALENQLIRILKNETFDIVQLEYLSMACYLDTIRKYSRAKVVLRAHNVEYLIWERIAQNCKNPLKKSYLKHLCRTLKRFEIQTYRQVDGIACITPVDEMIIKSHAPKTPLVVIPFGIQPDKIPERPAALPENPTLFHLGSMNWQPNLEGISWFLKAVWPDFSKRNPAVILHLAGREIPAWLTQSSFLNVVVDGEVPDAWAYMQSHHIMVVPLLSGSGIRVKIIEGMAIGKPIITTSIGAEGIQYTNGENILIADSAVEFIEAMECLISDEKLRISLGENAKKLIFEKHNTPKLMATLERFYQNLNF